MPCWICGIGALQLLPQTVAIGHASLLVSNLDDTVGSLMKLPNSRAVPSIRPLDWDHRDERKGFEGCTW